MGGRAAAGDSSAMHEHPRVVEGVEVMTATDLEVLSPTERNQIERWRAYALERAGFDVPLARTLAARFDVDLHVAIALVRNGCPPELAARILL
jgi:hypothetical protein